MAAYKNYQNNNKKQKNLLFIMALMDTKHK